MLNNFLKTVQPEILSQIVKENPRMVLSVLQTFPLFKLFGESLTVEQQLAISNNLHKLEEFFKSSAGKDSISLVVSEFVDFVKPAEKAVIAA